MEKNIEVKIIKPYEDLELNEVIDYGKTMWITEKRARELNNKKIIKIIQIRRV